MPGRLLKRLLTALLYVVLISIMLWAVLFRVARGCRTFIP